MNPVSKFLIPICLIGLALVAACSAHITGGDVPTPSPDAQANFADPRPTISGPAVEGHWMSACNPQSGRNSYRQYDVTFKGSTVTRNESLYADAACSVSSSKLNYHGRFRFIDKYSDGSFNIEYAFDLGGGVTTFPQEKLLVANNKLLVSEFVTGDLAFLLSTEPLMLANQTQANSSSSTNVSAQQVSSYADAKYAFCETQGYGIMVDFMGGDLSKTGTGTARMGSKSCGSSSEIKWGTATYAYTVNLDSGLPQIAIQEPEFGNSGIKPYSYQSGLAGHQGAHTVLFGNSGECYFLRNAGTLNLDFTYSCH